jgi:CheY-like chemotaxis protein
MIQSAERSSNAEEKFLTHAHPMEEQRLMKQARILVIDDDEGITEVIQIVLESEGYEVEVSPDGKRLEQTEVLPDLILLDLRLIGQNGLELCQALKNNPTTAHIPIILLSANADTGSLAASSGANGFIEKPFDVDDLVAMVQKYVGVPSSD